MRVPCNRPYLIYLQGSSSRQSICARPAHGSAQGSPSDFKNQVGFLLLCLLTAAIGLIAQTNPYIIPVGSNHSALGINPATNQIHVVNSSGNTVAVINGGKLTAAPISVTAGSIPSAVVNPVTNKIYVVNNASNNVSVIDGATNTFKTSVTVAPILFRLGELVDASGLYLKP